MVLVHGEESNAGDESLITNNSNNENRLIWIEQLKNDRACLTAFCEY